MCVALLFIFLLFILILFINWKAYRNMLYENKSIVKEANDDTTETMYRPKPHSKNQKKNYGTGYNKPGVKKERYSSESENIIEHYNTSTQEEKIDDSPKEYANKSSDHYKERYSPSDDSTKQERINFPFRAILREMPQEEIYAPPVGQKLQQRERIRDPTTHNIPVEYYQLKQRLQQPLGQNINELYPSPYTAGERYTKQYVVSPYTSGTIAIRDTERPYQDITTEFIRVGTAYTEDQKDNIIMTLYRRDIAPERDLYEYKLVDKTNGNDIEIYLPLKTQFLRNGEKITIPGYEGKGKFTIHLDSRYKYARIRPFN
jgi:hypothetical protein